MNHSTKNELFEKYKSKSFSRMSGLNLNGLRPSSYSIHFIVNTLIILLLLLAKIVLSQTSSVVSKNSNYFASLSFDGKKRDTIEVTKQDKSKTKVLSYNTNTINIYHVPSEKWIQSLVLKSKRKNPVDEMRFSYDGGSFLVRMEKSYTIFDVKTGMIVKEIKEADIVAFANNDDIFVVYTPGNLTLFDSKTGKFIRSYKIASYLFHDIEFDFNDRYIICKAGESKIVIYEVLTSRIFKRFYGREIRFNPNGDKASVMGIMGGRLSVTTYNLPFFKKSSFVSFDKLLKNKQRFEYLTSPYRIIEDQSSLSPSGDYTVLSIENRKVKSLIVVDNETGFNNEIRANENESVYPYFWDRSNALIINTSPLSGVIYNPQAARLVIEMNYKMENTGSNKVSSISPNRDLVFSSNRKYIIQPHYSNDKTVLKLRSTVLGQEPSVVSGWDYLNISENSKYVFVQNSQMKPGYILTYDIDADMKNNTELVVHNFSDTLSPVSIEDFIVDDGNAPEGYDYKLIKEFRHISSVPENELVKLYLKTVEIQDSTTGLQVHLMDREGNYYFGASEPEWKHIWCSLILKSYISGEIAQVKNFVVEEYKSNDQIPNAIALVLDHSGSMGETRAMALQYGAEIFIKQKREKDAIALIKYDDKIGVEVPLTANVNRLVADLKKEGLKGYGSSTALLDAVGKGVSILKNAKGYGRKAVVILTDGMENASFMNKGQVIKNANGEDINVYTVGFGDYVSENYLKAIASYTEGSFYQIYKTQDFRWIFDDIYKKMRNYYNIKFKTSQKGEYTTLLSICYDKQRRDSIYTTFSNVPINYNLIDDMTDAEFVPSINPPKTITYEVEDFKAYSDSIIKDIVPKKEYEKRIIIDFGNINFPNIQFEYDQTLIIAGTEKGIEEVSAFMKKYPEIRIQINGHTDNLGDEKKNQELSEARAKKVKELLTKLGTNSSRVHAAGYGESMPIFDNNSDEGRAKNRRVEFEIILPK